MGTQHDDVLSSCCRLLPVCHPAKVPVSAHSSGQPCAPCVPPRTESVSYDASHATRRTPADTNEPCRRRLRNEKVRGSNPLSSTQAKVTLTRRRTTVAYASFPCDSGSSDSGVLLVCLGRVRRSNPATIRGRPQVVQIEVRGGDGRMTHPGLHRDHVGTARQPETGRRVPQVVDPPAKAPAGGDLNGCPREHLAELRDANLRRLIALTKFPPIGVHLTAAGSLPVAGLLKAAQFQATRWPIWLGGARWAGRGARQVASDPQLIPTFPNSGARRDGQGDEPPAGPRSARTG